MHYTTKTIVFICLINYNLYMNWNSLHFNGYLSQVLIINIYTTIINTSIYSGIPFSGT